MTFNNANITTYFDLSNKSSGEISSSKNRRKKD